MTPPPDSTNFPEAAQAFTKIVENRRSIRLFEADPVPASVIEHCLDLALLAPNSSNLQPWEFHWVKTPAVKAELVKACLSQAAAATAAELIVCVARTNTWRENRDDMLAQLSVHEKQGARIPKAAKHYYDTLVPLVYNQGIFGVKGFLKRVYIYLQGLRKPISREPSSHAEMKIWAVKSTALACENFMLAVSSHGFDTCAMEGFDSARVRKILGLPSDATTVMVLGIGKRRPNGVTLPRIRRSRDHFIKSH